MRFLTIFLLSLFFFPFLGLGQVSSEPEMILSWRSDDYQPAFYEGKSFASRGASIHAALEIVESGRLVDLSSSEIRWYLDGRLIQSGRGLGLISFSLDNKLLKDYALRAVIHRYKNGGDIEKELLIVSRPPQALIRSLQGEGLISGPSAEFEALPYGFSPNVEDLIFTWTANGREARGSGEDGRVLNLNLLNAGPKDELILSLKIENTKNELETASITKIFLVQ